jgi:hypothetical protein
MATRAYRYRAGRCGLERGFIGQCRILDNAYRLIHSAIDYGADANERPHA